MKDQGKESVDEGNIDLGEANYMGGVHFEYPESKWDTTKLPVKYEPGKLKGGDSRDSPKFNVDVIDGDEIYSPWQLLEHNAKVVGDVRALGERPSIDKPYRYITYKEEYDQAVALGQAMVEKLGLKRGDVVGMFFPNRSAFWKIAFACMSQAMVFTSLYDTFGEDNVHYIVKHSEAKVIFVEKKNIPLLKQLKYDDEEKDGKPPTLVVVDDQEWHESDYKSIKDEFGVEYALTELIEKNDESKVPIHRPHHDSIATIMYTSGTTAHPKGVLLSHRNLVSGYMALVERIHPQVRPASNDHAYCSFLPHAHILSVAVELLMMRMQARIGFYRGDRLTLLDDVKEIGPTIFAAVPRVYQRMYDRIMAMLKEGGALKRMIFNGAFKYQKHWAARNTRSPIADKVFHPIREKFGGRVMLAVSTAAPLPLHLAWFARVCVADRFMEGWGMTETTGGSCTQNWPYTTSWYGHVGHPCVSADIKLVDVPEMNYRTTDLPHPRGEICVRGPCVFKGYYKDEANTKATIDEQGWCHSGDVGQWVKNSPLSRSNDGDGCMVIIDRIKSIVKLSQGEYVSPEKIEGILASSMLVSQIWATGNSFKDFMVAVVFPDVDQLKALYKSITKKAVDEVALELMIANEAVAAAISTEIKKIGKEAGMRGFEIPKYFKFVAEEFGVENDLLTPSLKLKRANLQKHFAADIEALYEQK